MNLEGAKMKHSMLVLAALLLAANAARAEIVRYPIPNSNFPIAQAVRVSGDAVITYVSGQVPPVVSKEAEPSSPQAYGDVKTRPSACSTRSSRSLKAKGSAWAT